MANVVLISQTIPYEDVWFNVPGADKFRCEFTKHQTRRAIRELSLTRQDDLDSQVICRITTLKDNPPQSSSCWFDDETGLIWVCPPGALA
jgi:hypothetical protein